MSNGFTPEQMDVEPPGHCTDRAAWIRGMAICTVHYRHEGECVTCGSTANPHCDEYVDGARLMYNSLDHDRAPGIRPGA